MDDLDQRIDLILRTFDLFFGALLDNFFRLLQHLAGQRTAATHLRAKRMRRRYIFRLSALLLLAIFSFLGFGYGPLSR